MTDLSDTPTFFNTFSDTLTQSINNISSINNYSSDNSPEYSNKIIIEDKNELNNLSSSMSDNTDDLLKTLSLKLNELSINGGNDTVINNINEAQPETYTAPSISTSPKPSSQQIQFEVKSYFPKQFPKPKQLDQPIVINNPEPLIQKDKLNIMSPIVNNITINPSDPLQNHSVLAPIVEYLLPISNISQAVASLKDRKLLADFIKSTLLFNEDGIIVDSLKYNIRQLLKSLKTTKLNPYITNQTYGKISPYSMPKDFIIYRSCFPIKYIQNSIKCDMNSTQINLRFYKLTRGEVLERRNEDIIKQSKVLSEVEYYKLVKQIIEENECPNFVLMYGYNYYNDKSIDFEAYNTKINKGRKLNTTIVNLIPDDEKEVLNKEIVNEVIKYLHSLGYKDIGKLFDTYHKDTIKKIYFDYKPVLTPEQLNTLIRFTVIKYLATFDNVIQTKINDQILKKANRFNYLNDFLLMMTESPTYNIYDWASKTFIDNVGVKTMTNTGYHSYYQWLSVLFQMLSAYSTLIYHDVYIPDFSLHKNVFIKNIDNIPTIPKVWKYIVNGIEYYIPNYGDMVLIDSSFTEGINGEDKIKINEPYNKWTMLNLLIESLNPTNFTSNIFVEKGGSPPDEKIMSKMEQIYGFCHKDLMTADANIFIKAINELFYEFMNNRLGTYLTEEEYQSITSQPTEMIDANTKSGKFVIYKDENDTKYKIGIYYKPSDVIPNNAPLIDKSEIKTGGKKDITEYDMTDDYRQVLNLHQFDIDNILQNKSEYNKSDSNEYIFINYYQLLPLINNKSYIDNYKFDVPEFFKEDDNRCYFNKKHSINEPSLIEDEDEDENTQNIPIYVKYITNIQTYLFKYIYDVLINKIPYLNAKNIIDDITIIYKIIEDFDKIEFYITKQIKKFKSNNNMFDNIVYGLITKIKDTLTTDGTLNALDENNERYKIIKDDIGKILKSDLKYIEKLKNIRNILEKNINLYSFNNITFDILNSSFNILYNIVFFDSILFTEMPFKNPKNDTIIKDIYNECQNNISKIKLAEVIKTQNINYIDEFIQKKLLYINIIPTFYEQLEEQNKIFNIDLLLTLGKIYYSTENIKFNPLYEIKRENQPFRVSQFDITNNDKQQLLMMKYIISNKDNLLYIDSTILNKDKDKDIKFVKLMNDDDHSKELYDNLTSISNFIYLNQYTDDISKAEFHVLLYNNKSNKLFYINNYVKRLFMVINMKFNIIPFVAYNIPLYNKLEDNYKFINQSTILYTDKFNNKYVIDLTKPKLSCKSLNLLYSELNNENKDYEFYINNYNKLLTKTNNDDIFKVDKFNVYDDKKNNIFDDNKNKNYYEFTYDDTNKKYTYDNTKPINIYYDNIFNLPFKTSSDISKDKIPIIKNNSYCDFKPNCIYRNMHGIYTYYDKYMNRLNELNMFNNPLLKICQVYENDKLISYGFIYYNYIKKIWIIKYYYNDILNKNKNISYDGKYYTFNNNSKKLFIKNIYDVFDEYIVDRLVVPIPPKPENYTSNYTDDIYNIEPYRINYNIDDSINILPLSNIDNYVNINKVIDEINEKNNINLIKDNNIDMKKDNILTVYSKINNTNIKDENDKKLLELLFTINILTPFIQLYINNISNDSTLQQTSEIIVTYIKYIIEMINKMKNTKYTNDILKYLAYFVDNYKHNIDKLDKNKIFGGDDVDDIATALKTKLDHILEVFQDVKKSPDPSFTGTLKKIDYSSKPIKIADIIDNLKQKYNTAGTTDELKNKLLTLLQLVDPSIGYNPDTGIPVTVDDKSKPITDNGQTYILTDKGATYINNSVIQVLNSNVEIKQIDNKNNFNGDRSLSAILGIFNIKQLTNESNISHNKSLKDALDIL